jgi:signal transduction histidine kinase
VKLLLICRCLCTAPRWWSTAGAVLALASLTWPQSTRSSSIPLIHADQVRQLSPEQAGEGLPVRIRGVITGDVPAPDFFVQDSTAGIYVEGSHAPIFEHRLGEVVEVEGITGPGKFAPVIRERSLHVLGKGRLPQGKLHAFSELAEGQLDSQWVQVRGIIRSASIDRTSWRETTLALRVASQGGEFNARVPIQHEQDFSSWIDREALIEGVCGSLFTSQRQLSGVLLYVPRLSFIKLEESAHEVPFSALLRFSTKSGARQRVRVRGVVAFQQPGNALFLQSQGRGLRVLTQQDTRVEPGDLVDVLGFPAVGESVPVLTDAVFHRIARGQSSSAVPLLLDSPWEQYDGALVTSDVNLLERQRQSDGVRFLLRSGDYLFEASLHAPKVDDRLLALPLNSRIQVTGICLVRSGGLWSIPQSIRLLLRSADDVKLLSAPSWWNFRHAMWLLALTASILLIVLAWVVVLGRRLREQMAIIGQKLRSGAVLEERNRIARELHDTLEQDLAGITMQLDLASDCFRDAPRVAQEALETARSMSRHSMAEARRSVWDLRCHLLENGDLISAIEHEVKALGSRDHANISFHVSGTPARLPGSVEMNLLRIAQEAVANAIKHARAQKIAVHLQYHPKRIHLSVSDDGRGFAPSHNPQAGHFGLLDMRERAQSMGSRLIVETDPGRGTRIVLEAPVHPSDLSHAELKSNTYSGS